MRAQMLCRDGRLRAITELTGNGQSRVPAGRENWDWIQETGHDMMMDVRTSLATEPKGGRFHSQRFDVSKSRTQATAVLPQNPSTEIHSLRASSEPQKQQNVHTNVTLILL